MDTGWLFNKQASGHLFHSRHTRESKQKLKKCPLWDFGKAPNDTKVALYLRVGCTYILDPVPSPRFARFVWPLSVILCLGT